MCLLLEVGILYSCRFRYETPTAQGAQVCTLSDYTVQVCTLYEYSVQVCTLLYYNLQAMHKIGNLRFVNYLQTKSLTNLDTVGNGYVFGGVGAL